MNPPKSWAKPTDYMPRIPPTPQEKAEALRQQLLGMVRQRAR